MARPETRPEPVQSPSKSSSSTQTPRNEAFTGRNGAPQNEVPDATPQVSDATTQSPDATKHPPDATRQLAEATQNVTQKPTETAKKPAQLTIPGPVRSGKQNVRHGRNHRLNEQVDRIRPLVGQMAVT
jgi:septum formation inhibitor MinC